MFFKKTIKYFLFILILFTAFLSNAQMTISGTLTDSISGENIPYASVYIEETGEGTITNSYGYFSLEVDKDTVILSISHLGYAYKQFLVTKDNLDEITYQISAEINNLEIVEIKISKSNLKEQQDQVQMSSISIPIKEIQNLPSLGGETDVLKIVQLMPGVNQGTEGQNGMYVRGGDVDQNLVLLDEAVVYNLGHLFGFFSVFNPDAIKDMKLTTGGFAPQYGGRLSSIVNINMKEGNMKEYKFKGGIGLLSSRLMVEGPIIKDKLSFMIAGRRTYIDQLFKYTGSFLPYYFYDLNLKVNYKISEKDHLYLSSYIGSDVLSLNTTDVDPEGQSDFGFTLGNRTSTLRWNHIINNKHFVNYSLIYTAFKYDINGTFPNTSLFVSSAINDVSGKADFEYYFNKNHKLKYGVNVINHAFNPTVVNAQGEITDVLKSKSSNLLRANEYAFYLGHEVHIDSTNWFLNYGARFSGVFISGGDYQAVEPRVSIKYNINKNHNLKFAYTNMRQYMHLVSSSTLALPTDLWYLATEDIKPQIADQTGVSYSYFNQKLRTVFTTEVYYKYMQNLTEYKEGANLILNSDFEEELLQGNGESYGIELLAKKDEGKFTGWLSYTLSYSKRQFDELNEGDWFYARYDRRHSFSAVTSYRFNKKWNFSAVWVFLSGSRFTPQIGFYAMPNASLTGVDLIPEYASRNSVQLSSTHRLDINVVYKIKDTPKYKSEWHFGIYNVYNRTDPWRIEVRQNLNQDGYEYIQPGLFGLIPSVAYNFEF